MTWTAGIDGCKDGWVVVRAVPNQNEVDCLVVRHISTLFDQALSAHAVAIDIPIGLSEQAPRDCDLLARQALPGKASSVFPPPLRVTLAARDYAEAKALNRRACGKAISLQAWHILPKIREVDQALRARKHRRVFEAHPELAFLEMNNRVPLQHPKRRLAGRLERQKLLQRTLGRKLVATAETQAQVLRKQYRFGTDDLYDALALLWTSRRLLHGEAVTLPAKPPCDSCGLAMSISY